MNYELKTTTPSFIEFTTASYYDTWIEDHNSSLIEFLTARYYDLWIEDNYFFNRVFDG